MLYCTKVPPSPCSSPCPLVAWIPIFPHAYSALSAFQVRERQLAMKERKEAMARARDAEHHERLLRQMAEYDDKEAEAKRKAEEKIRLVRRCVCLLACVHWCVGFVVSHLICSNCLCL